MHEGLGSSTFAVAIAMSSIVMYDAAGVRRHAGKWAISSPSCLLVEVQNCIGITLRKTTMACMPVA